MINFGYAYFSRDIAEFWRRWHISLSTWLKDYLYITLGGSKHGKVKSLRYIFTIFIVSGFWHGANWTFIVWGGLNALFFVQLYLLNRNRNRNNLDPISQGKLLPSFKNFSGILLTFILVYSAWIFFRSETITDAVQFVNRIILNFSFIGISSFLINKTILLLILFVGIEWLLREQSYLFERNQFNRPFRWLVYLTIGCIILLFAPKEAHSFIYFQF